VYVNRGHITMQASAGVGGPSAWSTKKGEWEELRVCTNGQVPADHVLVWNEDPNGSDFLVDRVEAYSVFQPVAAVIAPRDSVVPDSHHAMPSRRRASAAI
jgi:hypothetical protein